MQKYEELGDDDRSMEKGRIAHVWHNGRMRPVRHIAGTRRSGKLFALIRTAPHDKDKE